MQRFTDLKVWQKSHHLALGIYRVTAEFPRSELFGITAQLRRAGVSISANIAEGAKRQTAKDYARFLNVAEGSLAEVLALLLLARDLGMVSEPDAKRLLTEADEAARMLHGLRLRVCRADKATNPLNSRLSTLD